MFKEIWDQLHRQQPLVHCITNYVTVADVANMVLAAGASPIMADEEREVEEITSLCQALCLNIGTLNQRVIASMVRAGQRAAALRRPVILDPVGAGASTLRTQTAALLIREVRPTVIRGNISEIKALASLGGGSKGVDAAAADLIDEDHLAEAVELVHGLSRETGAVIAVTGAIDVAGDGEKAYVVRNGSPLMSRITGAGCMLSALMAAVCGANPAQPLASAALALAWEGLAGERAAAKTAAEQSGTASFGRYLIDQVNLMDFSALKEGMRLEHR